MAPAPHTGEALHAGTTEEVGQRRLGLVVGSAPEGPSTRRRASRGPLSGHAVPSPFCRLVTSMPTAAPTPRAVENRDRRSPLRFLPRAPSTE